MPISKPGRRLFDISHPLVQLELDVSARNVGLVAEGRLQRILPDWDGVEHSVFYLVLPASRHRSTPVRRVMAFLQANVVVPPC
nr:hypothetical protein [uncultured Albidiferax sp.]